METTSNATAAVISPESLLAHWQGHRSLTRKVIEAFPEDELFNYTVGGMRPFSVLAMEMIDLAGPGMHGLITGDWDNLDDLPHLNGTGMPETKAELLALWDDITEQVNQMWEELEPGRFQETVLAFNQFEGPVHDIILYWIDNEVHHRGQGYVYLRSLGIEPPAFWDR